MALSRASADADHRPRGAVSGPFESGPGATPGARAILPHRRYLPDLTGFAVPGLILILAALIILPVGVLAIGSFLSEPPRALQFNWAGLTFRNYIAVLTDPGFFSLLGATFGISLVGTVGAIVIGTSLAWLAVRTDMPGRPVLNAIAIMPMFVPPLVGAFAWEILASPRSGVLNILFRAAEIPIVFNIYTYTGIAFVFAIYYAPYVYLFTSSALRNMDPVFEEAAALSGAGRFLTTIKITLPLIAPALLSSGILVFVLLIQLFSIPAVLGEPGNIKFMSARIWEMTGFTPTRINAASALGMMMLAMTIALVLIQQRVQSRRSFVTIAGKGLRPTLIKLGSARWPLAFAGYAYLIFVVILPYAALMFIAFRRNLFFSSFATMVDPAQFSMRQFGVALTDPYIRLALSNSMIASLWAVVIGSILYFSIAYVVHRTRLAGRKMLNVVASMPIAIPGIILGLGYLWSWISIPVGISGTLWIIILAYVAQFAPQGVHAISGALMQIHPELEESARLSGAGFGYTLRRVVIPLAWPGILAAMTLLMVLSFRELATALFLYTTSTVVFSISMFDSWSRGTTGLVAIMAIMQSVVVFTLAVAGQMIRRRQGTELK